MNSSLPTRMLLLSWFGWLAGNVVADPLGTAFTYQGQLADGGHPATGSYDLQFAVFDAASGPSQIGPTRTNTPVQVTNGLFTVTLDFGPGLFAGDARWLEIGVRTNGGGAFATLSPRQPLTPAPHALYAPSAGSLSSNANQYFTGTVSFSPPAGPPFSVGNSNKVDRLNADLLDGLEAAAFWKRGGNAGTTLGANILGTTENQPLELIVRNQRALRLEPSLNSDDGPNVIGGHQVNYVSPGVVGATIGGGGYRIVVMARPNAVLDDYGTVGGGAANTAGGGGSTVAGGGANSVWAPNGSIGGGGNNEIDQLAASSTIAGGFQNRILAYHGSIGGGTYNEISLLPELSPPTQFDPPFPEGSTICGGFQNRIRTNATACTIGGGAGNLISSNTAYATIGGGHFNSVHGGNTNRILDESCSDTIRRHALGATIGGGVGNTIRLSESFMTDWYRDGWTNYGGRCPTAAATIGGGQFNRIENRAIFATIPGGLSNQVTEPCALAAGRRAQALHAGAFVWADATDASFSSTTSNQFAVRASGGVRLETGGTGLSVDGQIIFGGGTPGHPVLELRVGNLQALRLEADTNGCVNSIASPGYNGVEQPVLAAIIGGGTGHLIHSNADRAVIAGGSGNTIGTFAENAVISGGSRNVVSNGAYFAVIPGGERNTAAGDYSFATGRRAKALHDGAFVWADSTDADFASSGNNQFCVRAAGGLRLADNTSQYFGFGLRQMLNLYDTGYGLGVQDYTLYHRSGKSFAWYCGGAHHSGETNAGGGRTLMVLNTNGLTVNGVLASSSDRNQKERFVPATGREVLDKVVALPIATWNFKDDPATRHIGPMAQDFHAAFGLGADDKHIATVDADGVALAAIQGLNQKLAEELKRRDAENAQLRQRLDKLEHLLLQQRNDSQ